jgi:hypothetical protein
LTKFTRVIEPNTLQFSPKITQNAELFPSQLSWGWSDEQ